MKLSTLVLPACFLLFAGPASVAGSESSNLRGGIVGIADATAAEDAVSTSAEASIALSPEANDGDGIFWPASIHRKLCLFGLPCGDDDDDDDDGGGIIPPIPEIPIPEIPIPEIPIPEIPPPEVPGCPDGNPGDGCSAFCPCRSGNSCEAFTQTCRAPGDEGDPCHATRPCGSGLNCEAGTQTCRGPGRVGDPCHLTRPCKSGLSCEAGTQTCRAPGDVGDPCHLTRPCGSGLSCHPGVQKCYNLPRQEGQPCVAGHECGSGLSCEAGTQTCRAPGDVGDPCHLTRPCKSGLSCEAGTQTCRAPGDEGDPCHLTRPCKSGLSCEAFTQTCRAPGRVGDPCDIVFGTASCADGFECVDLFDAKTKQGGGFGIDGNNFHEFPTGSFSICLPECVEVSSEIKSTIKDGKSDGNGGYGKKWNNGIMPYVVDCEMEKHERSPIALAMRTIEDNTSIRFERYNKDVHANYVIFDDVLDGYHARGVGRKETPGWQHVNINGDWWSGVNLIVAAHEIMHALGWPHTQQRPDRDEYVKINWDNIEEKKKTNYYMLDVTAGQAGSDVWESVQKCKGYNYKSVMHYGGGGEGDFFTELGLAEETNYKIETLDPSKQELIGSRDVLSTQDVRELEEYFFGPHCPPASVPPSTSRDQAPGKVGEDCDLTRLCGSGLSCHPGVQKCYDFPRKEGQPCAAWYDCTAGLNCEAVSQVCETVPAEPTASPVPTTEAPLAPEPTEISAPESTLPEPTASPVPTTEAPLAPEPTEISAPESSPTSATSKTATITAVFAAAIATLLLF